MRRPPLPIPAVRFWHLADVPLELTNVCFEGKSGLDADVTRCLLLTHSGHGRQLVEVVAEEIEGRRQTHSCWLVEVIGAIHDDQSALADYRGLGNESTKACVFSHAPW